MSTYSLEIFILLALIAANGVFAMAELAIASSRKSRLEDMAVKGSRGARQALDLANDPNRFLSTVQIGITLIGTLAGAYGGATLAIGLDDWVEGAVPALAPYSKAIGLGVVVLSIAYLSLIFGELVPKRLALSSPERISALVAAPLRWLSVLAMPVVHFLSLSTNLVLAVLRIRPSEDLPVTEEEITILIKQGAQAGVFEEAEHDIVRRVFRLGDRRAVTLMTPRSEVVWIDVADAPEEVQRKITASPHSRFPVCDGSLDTVLGVVQVKDLLTQGFAGRPFDIRGILIVPLFIYEGTRGLKVLDMFKNTGTHIAIVLDEYGSVEGLLTLNDILEAIVGDLPDPDEPEDPKAVQRPDGSWLFDGMIALDECWELLGRPALPQGDYHTLAGFVITRLGHIPTTAERFDWDGLSFEIVDMDANRVDKVLVAPIEGDRSLSANDPP
ncbi:hemolysin family protein [soil metagenome]